MKQKKNRDENHYLDATQEKKEVCTIYVGPIELPERFSGNEIDIVEDNNNSNSERFYELASAFGDYTNQLMGSIIEKATEELPEDSYEVDYNKEMTVVCSLRQLESKGRELNIVPRNPVYHESNLISVKPNNEQDSIKNYTVNMTFYPYDFKAVKGREIVERYNALFEAGATSLFDLSFIQDDIESLLKGEDVEFNEVEVARIEKKLSKMESEAHSARNKKVMAEAEA